MIRAPRIPFVSLMLALAALPLAAQTVPFGKNKIQYRDFDWHVLSGDHVDVYYYPEEQQVARLALGWAEQSYAFLERKFQHHPFRRIPLIVYSSDQHFEQTNVLSGFIPEGVLGFTEYLKRRVALPFRGDYDQFRKTLRHELVHAFQLSKLREAELRNPRYRGESPQRIQWWTEGLAEFWSGEQTTEDEMFVRDLVVNGNLPTIRQFNHSYGFMSYPLGAELHKYLAHRFGEDYIVRLYEQYRSYDSFEDALEGVLGVDLERLSREWRYALEQHFFPTYAQRPPLDIGARRIVEGDGIEFKPLVYAPGPDTTARVLFLSPRTGYTNLYRTSLEPGDDAETIVKGERSAEFESFHAFESGFDVNRNGIIALVSKFMERDALLLWDQHGGGVVGRYQWNDLVGLRSPAFDATGQRLVFEALSTAGFSDLYVLDFATGTRTALTHDRYRDADPDWSPDGGTIVFSSDRTVFGDDGGTNLFLLDVAADSLRYLTFGPWHDQQPRWSRDGTRIAFTSDRDGSYQIYTVDRRGGGRRITNSTGGAFDADWLPADSGVVFAGFQGGTFHIYRADLPPDTVLAARFALARKAPPGHATIAYSSVDDGRERAGRYVAAAIASPAPTSLSTADGGPAIPAGWSWIEEPASDSVLADARTTRYSNWKKLSVDFAAADALVAPGLGSAQGAQFLASDLLGNHIIFAGVSAVQVQDFSHLVDSFSGNLLYLNLEHRLNYGLGVFRFKGRFRDVAFDIYEEQTYGSYFVASYPFSKYNRVELQLGLERSNRVDTEDSYEIGFFGHTTRPDPRDLTRKGILASNYVSYVKDNTLWVSTGPIDGERFNITAGLVTCFACSAPSQLTGHTVTRSAAGENYVLFGDYRRYFRTSLYSAYAIRAYAFFSGGAIPGRAVLGGSRRLRGYPQFSLAGSRLWLLNQEWRFPILRSINLTFPFGNLRLPGVQGAFFADVGSSWLETQERPEGTWGSYGMGFRTSLGPPLVLRLDVGRRFRFGGPPPVVFGGGEGFNDTFVDFFFGFNY